MIKNISATVRINNSGDPFKDTYDLMVEVLKDGEWTLYRGYNTLSNDYAYSEARSAANAAKEKL